MSTIQTPRRAGGRGSRRRVDKDEAGHRTLDPERFRASADEILNRRPAVGLALGVVRNGALEFFYGHGCADIASKTPITEDTVFRIGSITKTVTALALMQLWEQGLVDLDAPANDYLRAFQLAPETARWRAATIRHLLTHTSGIPEVVHVADLLHPSWGPFNSRPAVYSVKAGDPLPSLADYYRSGLPVVAEPGTAFAYTNHGFATLGQIVEDVSGVPLEHYLRAHIFEPLGMTDTDLVRSERVAARLATGYVIERSGPRAVPDRDWISTGATNVYSTTRDVARYAAALLGGGSNEQGAILKPATLASMFEPHYQPDPHLVGMGLGFFRHDAGGHRIVGHDGIEPGFNASLLVAPDDGIGVVAFTNGSPGAMGWLPIELERLLHGLIDVPDESIRTDVPHHPDIWGEICGTYRLPQKIADLRGRVLMGDAQVFVRGGTLMMRFLRPIPALYRGFPLHPDDETNPYVFRIDLSLLGIPSVRLVFDHEMGVETTVVHTDLGGQPLSFYTRLPARSQQKWAAGAIATVAGAGAVTVVRRATRGGLGQAGDDVRRHRAGAA
jgi:CubicO group peptidase (beta-lactamase class C family)